MVLGSTCFAKRYGGSDALGAARFGGSGGGRLLTDEERQLLLDNTEALLAQFENELREALSKVALVRPSAIEVRPSPVEVQRIPLPPSPSLELPKASPVKESPWTWMKPMTSTIYFRLRDGSGWVRVQRKDGQQLLAPWPVFNNWDKAFLDRVGPIDTECGAYVLFDVVSALAYLRSLAAWETKPGSWRDVAAEIAKRSRWQNS